MKRFSRMLAIELLEQKRLMAADVAQCELAHGPAFVEAADAAPTGDSAIEQLRASHLEQSKTSSASTASEESDDESETDEQENETDESDENDTDESDENETDETNENETDDTDENETDESDEEQSLVSAKLSAAATNDVGSVDQTSNELGQSTAATVSANLTAGSSGSTTNSAMRSSASTAPAAGLNEDDSLDPNLVDVVYATADDRHVTEEESALLQCDSPAETSAATDAVFEGVATNLLTWTA